MLRIGRSFITGFVIVFLAALAFTIVSPIIPMMKTVWGAIFISLGIGHLLYPGLEIVLSVIMIYGIGRLMLSRWFHGLFRWLRDGFAKETPGEKGVPIYIDQDNEGYRPAFARGVTKVSGTFPHEYLVLCIMPLRGPVEGRFSPSSKVWVVRNMTLDEFMPLYAMAGIIIPDTLTLLPWEEWIASRTPQQQ